MGRGARKGLSEEFKFVKYEQGTRAQRATLDTNVDKILMAPALNGVLCCGDNLHQFNPQRKRVEKKVMEGLEGTTVIACIHIPELRAIYTSSLNCMITQVKSRGLQLQSLWRTSTAAVC